MIGPFDNDDGEDALAKAEAARKVGAPVMVFDWDRAAQRIKESGAREACAFLATDRFWTGGIVYKDGRPVPREDTYTFLASIWAVPTLELDGVEEPCWKYQADVPGWDASTYWPESALSIIKPN